MASGKAITDFCTIKNMFSWTFNDLDNINPQHLIGMRPSGNESYYGQYLVTASIEAIDYYTGKKYFASCWLEMQCKNIYMNVKNNRVKKVVIEIKPFPGMITGSYQINGGESHRIIFGVNNSSEMLFAVFEVEQAVQTLSFHLDVSGFRTKTFKVLPFQQPSKLVLSDELKYMYNNVPETEFVIKCENEEFKVAKPKMAARSPFFKTMFETEMKEKSQSFVEIKEFKPKIVEKMIKFCETDTIKDCEGLEDDLFKIAHLYQIQQLMYFAVEKMAESIDPKKVASYFQLADLYDLKEFKEWCLQYAQRNNIVVT